MRASNDGFSKIKGCLQEDREDQDLKIRDILKGASSDPRWSISRRIFHRRRVWILDPQYRAFRRATSSSRRGKTDAKQTTKGWWFKDANRECRLAWELGERNLRLEMIDASEITPRLDVDFRFSNKRKTRSRSITTGKIPTRRSLCFCALSFERLSFTSDVKYFRNYVMRVRAVSKESVSCVEYIVS